VRAGELSHFGDDASVGGLRLACQARLRTDVEFCDEHEIVVRVLPPDAT
jgi:hypothetical protein